MSAGPRLALLAYKRIAFVSPDQEPGAKLLVMYFEKGSLESSSRQRLIGKPKLLQGSVDYRQERGELQTGSET